MKLSELHEYIAEQKEEGNPVTHIYGIEVDDYVHEIPEGVVEIGLLAKMNEDGDDLDDDLADVITRYYKDAKLKVILEVPFGLEHDVNELVTNMQLLNYDISILLPGSDKMNDPEAWDEFYELNREYLECLFLNPKVKNQIYPVSSYFQYLLMECNNHIPETMATDDYINARFVEGVNVELMDKMKDKLREDINEQFEPFGGLETYARTLNVALAKLIANKAEEHMQLQNESVACENSDDEDGSESESESKSD
ncbi:hypothetical protein J8A87_21585 [Vibrio parahaemolyticus]|uniref:hypothetical protein n=1 Tax=Vibrio TaxID=662 RepID=UPI002963D4CF|nr:hypothetical protein [Vibrio sp. Vb0587]MBE4779743.1 hypothetical protein [Vibrio parahaemolyticus]MCF9167042.1 hypothetical protein [Vibrio parahaemolyticus]MDG3410202.1 hypothetical protein [Vibrio parahaemolyticus]MDW1965414.1 hypothetical protein [Vibrio sp. Vb0587]